jgi:adenylate kinase
VALYILLMGVQGAGKGEQSKFIQETYGIPQLSTGDLFRARKTMTDPLSVQIQEIMAKGGLISDDVTCKLVEEWLDSDAAKNGAIFDGFPRNPVQAKWLDEYLQKKQERLATAILLEIDLYTAFKRAFGRVENKETKKTYNIYFNNEGITSQFVKAKEDEFPPRLEVTETATNKVLFRRSDDANADAVVKRIDTYVAETASLVPYYEAQGILHKIDAHQSIPQVREEIHQIIESSRVKVK